MDINEPTVDDVYIDDKGVLHCSMHIPCTPSQRLKDLIRDYEQMQEFYKDLGWPEQVAEDVCRILRDEMNRCIEELDVDIPDQIL